MSTRELACSIFDRLSDKQLEEFVLMFQGSVPAEDVPNSETRKVLDDAKAGRGMSRTFATVQELMEDLNADD